MGRLVNRDRFVSPCRRGFVVGGWAGGSQQHRRGSLPKRKSRSQLVASAAVAVGMLSAGASVASAAPAPSMTSRCRV